MDVDLEPQNDSKSVTSSRKFVPQTGKLKHERHKQVIGFLPTCKFRFRFISLEKKCLFSGGMETKCNSILGIIFTAENTNLAKIRKCAPQNGNSVYLKSARLHQTPKTHSLPFAPQFLNEWKPKIISKSPLLQALIVFPQYSLMPSLGHLLWMRKASLSQTALSLPSTQTAAQHPCWGAPRIRSESCDSHRTVPREMTIAPGSLIALRGSRWGEGRGQRGWEVNSCATWTSSRRFFWG